jgi:hypothetical protein
MIKRILTWWYRQLDRAAALALMMQRSEEDQRKIVHAWFAGLSLQDKMQWLTVAAEITHEPLKLDGINSKMVNPVEGLVMEGKQYYEFVSTADMPEARFVHFQHLRRELAMAMTPEKANEFLNGMREAMAKGDVSMNGALIWMMQDMINNCTPIEVLYQLAALVYFEKDEDLSCFDHDYNSRKIKLFKRYPNQSFFLSRLLSKGLKNVGQESPEDIQKYLRASAVKLEAYNRILSEQGVSRTSETLKGT